MQRGLRAISLVAFCSLAMSYGHSQAHNNAHLIRGVLRDVDGRPAPGALVCAFPTLSSAGTLHWVRSDQQGRFEIWVGAGRYIVRAKDEAIGYADPNYKLSFDPRSRFPEVTVRDSGVSEVTVVLPPRGGTLAGVLVDRNTHHSISHGTVLLQVPGAPNASVQVMVDRADRFRFCMPNRAIRVQASARGYQSAEFGEVLLSNGENREVVMELTPKASDRHASFRSGIVR